MGVLSMFKRKKTKNKKEKKGSNAHKTPIKRYKLEKHDFQQWQKSTTVVPFENIIGDQFALTKEYVDLLERYIPNVSGAIWTWKHLCNTPLEMNFLGGTESERNQAQLIFKNLNRKINPIKSVKNGGFNHLLNIY